MTLTRSRLAIALDRRIVLRSLVTSLIVGTILIAIFHGAALIAGQPRPELFWQVPLTYLVPYVVATVSSVLTVRQRSTGEAGEFLLLEGEIQAINKFPGMNPNPVMRITRPGQLLYANSASAPILRAWGATVGESLSPGLVARLAESAANDPPQPVEVAAGRRTFEVLPVLVPELDVINLYGTDITAAKVVERFPDRNPFPVLRLAADGVLLYGNLASAPIMAALDLEIGQPVPTELVATIRAAAERTAAAGAEGLAGAEPIEIAADGRTFTLLPVTIPEFDFVNIYGSDVTATKTITKFPDQNPNPVLRFTRDGRLLYVNPAGEPVRHGLGVAIGQELPMELSLKVQELAARERIETLEVEGDGRLFSLLVVPVFEFGFINVYGTDITAARQVEQANRENERLLLNILPESIVGRLRAGEMTIADRIDEMTVMFADVVGFTEISARLSAGEVIAMLNGIFSAFDRLADRHGLEKIKTIGDAYMVCGGLTPHANDHARRVAEMGLEMLDFVAGYENAQTGAIQLRVGLHVGPAVAGVIGIKKFIYDIWGDTVNTASRMESHGIPGRIQVTAATAERLSGAYRFERRGMIEVKGKGQLETFFLAGRREDAPYRPEG